MGKDTDGRGHRWEASPMRGTQRHHQSGSQLWGSPKGGGTEASPIGTHSQGPRGITAGSSPMGKDTDERGAPMGGIADERGAQKGRDPEASPLGVIVFDLEEFKSVMHVALQLLIAGFAIEVVLLPRVMLQVV